MNFLSLFFLAVTLSEFFLGVVVAQDFEFPVQLIGFPVIILAVKISNFVRKLAYAVNPSTYQKRTKRSSFLNEDDLKEIERKLVSEMGEAVCVYENVCVDYAQKVNRLEAKSTALDWKNLFLKYEKAPKSTKKFYLLSVFLGDIVGSPELCRQIAKRGRSCHPAIEDHKYKQTK